MTEQNKPIEKKVVKQEDKRLVEAKKEIKSEPVNQKNVNEVKSDVKDNKEVKTETKVEEKKAEVKEVKPAKQVISKKEEAVARGISVHLSKRHGMYIGSFIKGKKIDEALNMLNDVIKMKRAIPFKGEIPHRRGNMMSGRYPINASKIFIQLLKALKGNTIVNGLDLDKTRIYFVHSTFASRPSRKLGKAKRAHITIKAKEFNTQKENKSGDKK